MHLQYRALLGLLGLVLFCGASSNAQPAEPVAARLVGISPTSLIFIKDTYYYIESSAQKNWFNALVACQQIGYELVSLQNEEKFNILVNFLISSRKKLYYWTSGNDLYTLGKHHWYPGNETVSASLWGPKQPDNLGGVQHCDALWKKSNSYVLKDDNCNLARYYICELVIPSATTAAPATSEPTTPASTSSLSTSAPESSSSTSAPESSSSTSAPESSSSTSAPESSSSTSAPESSSSTSAPESSSSTSAPESSSSTSAPESSSSTSAPESSSSTSAPKSSSSTAAP